MRNRTSPLLSQLSLLALVIAGSVGTEEVAVPLPIQAALFKKIFGYDQALEGKGDPTVLVVYAEDGSDRAAAAVRAFKQVGLNASAAKVNAAASSIGSASVAYAVGPAAAAVLRDLCISHRVLSVSGAGSLAESGQTAIAIGAKADGKPEIIVNLSRARAEGHQFSSSLLSLARVIF